MSRINIKNPRQNFSAYPAQGDVGAGGEGGGFGVDFDDECTVLAGGVGERGGWVNQGGRADDKADVALFGFTFSGVEYAERQHFAEENDVRAHQIAASETDGRAFIRGDFAQAATFAAVQTASLPDAAVQF